MGGVSFFLGGDPDPQKKDNEWLFSSGQRYPLKKYIHVFVNAGVSQNAILVI